VGQPAAFGCALSGIRSDNRHVQSFD
jgi:hypothetical protein